MKKIIILASIVFLLFSCKKKEVHLPKIPLNGKEEVQNYSSIWMFNNAGKLDLNEKNRISSTHWFFNIDKALSLKEILPEVVRLRVKHNTKSPHNTEKMDNYFSYANTLNNKLSYYQFDAIDYKFIKKEDLPKFNTESDTVLITDIYKEKLIPINNKTVQLAFTSGLSFQEYLLGKAIITTDSIKVAVVEYIIE